MLLANGEPVDGRTYMMRTAFQKDYDFRILDLNAQPAIPNKCQHTHDRQARRYPFTESQKLKLDQFVMNGGRLLCFIDNLYAEMDSFALKPETVAYDRNLNLTDLFFSLWHPYQYRSGNGS